MIKFSRLLFPLVCVGLFASCLDDNDTKTTQEVSQPLIGNVVLGNLKTQVRVKTAAGKDSTYTASLVGSAYPMYIDQVNNHIYTSDSLPYGTDVSKVVFASLSSTGVVVINKLSEAGDTTFSTADSTNFAVPRTWKVYSTDGAMSRTYKVSILVHKEIGDATSWNAYTAPALASTTVQRAFVVDNQLKVFALDGATPVLLTASKTAPATWQRTAITTSGIDLRSIQRMQSTFYALASGRLVSSTDGVAWTAVASNVVPTTLAMASNERLIGLANGKIYGTTNGTTWAAEAVADGTESLPTSNVSGAVLNVSSDKTLTDYLLVGQANGAMVTWKRTLDATGGETYPWVSYPAPSAYGLPTLENVSLLPYGSGTLLAGLKNGAPAKLYYSRDNGRTWRPDMIATPDNLAGSSLVAVTDVDNFIWLFAGGSGQVWRGRLNSLGWQTAQKTWTNAPRFVQ